MIMQFFNTDSLKNQQVLLELEKTTEADSVKQWVPAYHFFIRDAGGNRIGKCCLRVGNNENSYYGGHIGYEIDEPYRGHHYAAKACRLLLMQAKKHKMDYLIITCDPSNAASAKTCELAGGRYLETAVIPEDNEMYAEGKRQVMVYRFELNSVTDGSAEAAY